MHAFLAHDPAGPAATTPVDRSVRPVFLLTAGRALAFAVTFATPLVLARVFDPAEFGTYKQLFLLYATCAAVAQLGIAESLLYFLPPTPHRGGQYAVNGVLVLVGSGLVCLAFLALAGPHLAHWLGNPAISGLSGLLGVYTLFTLPAAVLEIVMTARRRFGGAGVAYGLSDVVRAIALVAPAVAFGTPEGLLAGAVTFSAVRLAITLLYLRWEYRGMLRPDPGLLREQLTYALPLQLGTALWVLVFNLHFYLVAARVDAATFAIYAVGCLQIPLVELLFTPAKNVLIVRMREAIAGRRPDAALVTWHDTTRRLALAYFPLVGILLVTAREFIPVLFTDRYAASVPIFMVWTTMNLIAAVQADGVLSVYADTRALAVVSAIQLVLVAGLVPALMPPFGLVGAVVGTALAACIAKSLVLVRAKRLMGVTLAQLLPWRSLAGILGAASMAALVALVARARLAPAPPLPLLAVTAGLYVATYSAVLSLRRRRGAATPSGPVPRHEHAGRVGAVVMRVLKEVAWWVLILTGATWIATQLNRRKPLVLSYHGIYGDALSSVLNFDGLHVRVDRFARQMRYLAARYHVVPLDRLLDDALRAARARPQAVITFDDGYANVYRHAYPVLRRLGLPAMVFVVTDFLRFGRTLWWDRLAGMVASTERTVLSFPIQSAERRFRIGTEREKREALRVLRHELVGLPPQRRQALLARLAVDLAVEQSPSVPFEPLSINELRALVAGGIAVGSHGRSHDSFLHLSADTLADELTESRRVLESATGRAVTWLCYPYGLLFSTDTIRAAARAGYRGAVSTIEGLNNNVPHPYAIRRIGVRDGMTMAQFIVAVSGLRDFLRGVFGFRWPRRWPDTLRNSGPGPEYAIDAPSRGAG